MVGTIFQGTYNRIRSGYILREVVDKLSTINFNASEDIHTVSVFYETMLREMRNAENKRAWRVPVEQLLANDCNLDMKNPNTRQDFEHMPPEQLADDILRKEQRILQIMAEIKQVLGAQRDRFEGSSKGG